jgi:hypothetical protein
LTEIWAILAAYSRSFVLPVVGTNKESVLWGLLFFGFSGLLFSYEKRTI